MILVTMSSSVFCLVHPVIVVAFCDILLQSWVFRIAWTRFQVVFVFNFDVCFIMWDGYGELLSSIHLLHYLEFKDYLVLHLLMLLSPFNHALIIFFERSVSETTSLCFVNGCRSRSSSFLIIVVASFALYIDVAISL